MNYLGRGGVFMALAFIFATALIFTGALGAAAQPNQQEGKNMTKEILGGDVSLPDGRVIPLSTAVRAGDFLYLSGQVPFGPDGKFVAGGIEAQTRQVFANIKAALALGGATLDDVVSNTVHLTRVEDFGAFNAVYAEHFPNGFPARTTVRADLMGPVLVEITAVAYKPE